MKTTISVGVVLMSGMLLSSCYHDDYTYYLENESSYSIDSAELIGSHQFSLAPGEIAGPFEGRSSGPWLAMSEPLLTLYVRVFSDADSTYRNFYGCARDMRPIKANGTYLFSIDNVSKDSTGVQFMININAVPLARADALRIASRRSKISSNRTRL